MLNKEVLKTQIYTGLIGIIPDAATSAIKCIFPDKTSVGDDAAAKFGETLSMLVSDPIADILANAIDLYVRNASIYGTLITTGSPFTQTAIIQSPLTLTNGKIPNTLGIM